ncbi:hypothetical protein D3C75_262450 [compost metagenome]
MKKYVAGFIAGIVFIISASAFADTVSLIGKKVTGEFLIVVNGKKLTDNGAVIDNKTNVPARALSEALGANVSVDNNTKTVYITSTESTSQINNPSEGSAKVSDEPNALVLDKEKEMKRIKYEIDMLKDNVISLKLSIETTKDNPWNYDDSRVKSEVEKKEKSISEIESKIKELETKLAELEK